jgi:hypothetical protein
MEELLPYYEREIGIFRAYSRQFAQRYPKTAGQLLIAGEHSEDPHIERLIQSFALLTARVSKRLDSDYPQFTESMLESLCRGSQGFTSIRLLLINLVEANQHYGRAYRCWNIRCSDIAQGFKNIG